MAARYRVGGTGNWSDTAKWSTSSGGAGGASVPTISDAAIFDPNTGGGTCTIRAADAQAACASLTTTGYTGTIDTDSTPGNIDLWIAGNVTLGGGMVFGSNPPKLVIKGNSTCALTTNGVEIPYFKIGLDEPNPNPTTSGDVTLADDLEVGHLIFQAGSIAAGSHDVDVTSKMGGSELAGSFNIDWGSGTWTVEELDFGSDTLYTMDPGTATLIVASGHGVVGPKSGVYDIICPNTKIVGSGSVYIGAFNCLDIDFTDFTGNLSSWQGGVYGDLTLGAGMTSSDSSTGPRLLGSSGTHILTSNGVVFNKNFNIVAAGATWQLADDLDLGIRKLTLTEGTFDANDFDVAGQFSSSTSNVRSLLMGAGEWGLRGTGTVWNLATTTNLTFDAETSTIIIDNDSATAKTFAGGGLTYYDFEWAGDGAGGLTLNGSNHFHGFKVNPRTDGGERVLSHQNNSEQTFDTPPDIVGDASNGIKLQRVSSGIFTYSLDAGEVDCDYLTLVNAEATGGATWNAGENSTDGGGNSGWIFQTTIAAAALLAAGAVSVAGAMANPVAFSGALAAAPAELSTLVTFPIESAPGSQRILLSGDMQSGADAVLLSGDMQSGDDFELNNGVLFGGALAGSGADLAGAVDNGTILVFAGDLAAGRGTVDGTGTSSIAAVAVLAADAGALDLFIYSLLLIDAQIVAERGEISAAVSPIAGVAGALGVEPATLAGEVNAKIGAIGDIAASSAEVAGAFSTSIDIAGAIAATAASLDATAITSDTLIFTGTLGAGAGTVAGDIKALIAASGALAAGAAQLDAAVSAIAGVVAQIAAEEGVVEGVAGVSIAAAGTLESGEATLTIDVAVESARRTVLIILY